MMQVNTRERSTESARGIVEVSCGILQQSGERCDREHDAENELEDPVQPGRAEVGASPASVSTVVRVAPHLQGVRGKAPHAQCGAHQVPACRKCPVR